MVETVFSGVADFSKNDSLSLELEVQADFMRRQDAPFSASVMDAAAVHLPVAPRCFKAFATWPGDRRAAALPLRLMAGLHALARAGTIPALSAAFAALDQRCEDVVATALAEADADLEPWLRQPTQTNEVARSAATMAALRRLSKRFGHPVELLELGASAGLNLLLEHFSFDLGGVKTGDPASLLTLRPQWTGAAPNGARTIIAAAAGVDMHPLDFNNPADCDRLFAYVWPDRRDRMRRLRQAIRVARDRTVELQQGDALDWMARRLGTLGPAGVTRCVVHTMFAQYLSADDREKFDRIMTDAAARADRKRPLARVSFEWTSCRTRVELVLETWPGGSREVLAHVHPYGIWIDWLTD